MSGLYTCSYSPLRSRAASPQIRSITDTDSQYLAELLAERQKLGSFMQILPICSRLLYKGYYWFSPKPDTRNTSSLIERTVNMQPNDKTVGIIEIVRVSGMASNLGFVDCNQQHHRSPSPMASPHYISNLEATEFCGWRTTPQEMLGFPQGVAPDWRGASPSAASCIMKKILRLEVPVDAYPKYNFVGRLLGPRGNSLKRVEASTGCRVYIRGKGSIKDSNQEEKMKGRPGYEHLNEPLHILIEAELPANVIDARLRHAQEVIEDLLKPVDESQDHYKRHQLRELALLNSGLREESPHPIGSVTGFNNVMKRSKTGR